MQASVPDSESRLGESRAAAVLARLEAREVGAFLPEVHEGPVLMPEGLLERNA
jgi:hypothetical protein